MTLDDIVRLARERGASDIHLEGGMPAALSAMAREVIGDEEWPEFVQRGSYDLSRGIHGVRCRINVLRSARGIGFAIRLLTSFQATLQRLNLHPDLRRLIERSNGLVLVSGPTGSGKTSTLAALIQEINLAEARHIITVESPIEYALTPRLSFIRQREVGRDTPSFAQALVDALREDPDVLMVGEMRKPEVMRLTLSAAETGHLVLATVHSSTAAEALQRVVASFPPEIQPAVCAQLADTLVGVVAQRLAWRGEVGVRVPECEVLMASTPVRALIRQGQFFKLASALETGAADGSWAWARYAEWLNRRTDWHVPKMSEELPPEPTAQPLRAVPSPSGSARPATQRPPVPPQERARPKPVPSRPAPPRAVRTEDGVLELGGEEEDPEAILRELEGGGRRRH